MKRYSNCLPDIIFYNVRCSQTDFLCHLVPIMNDFSSTYYHSDGTHPSHSSVVFCFILSMKANKAKVLKKGLHNCCQYLAFWGCQKIFKRFSFRIKVDVLSPRYRAILRLQLFVRNAESRCYRTLSPATSLRPSQKVKSIPLLSPVG